MQESQKFSKRFERACLMGLLRRELHRGQRPIPAAHKGRTHDRNRPQSTVQKHLDPQGPSTHENRIDEREAPALLRAGHCVVGGEETHQHVVGIAAKARGYGASACFMRLTLPPT